jgi:hypothetical protein
MSALCAETLNFVDCLKWPGVSCCWLTISLRDIVQSIFLNQTISHCDIFLIKRKLQADLQSLELPAGWSDSNMFHQATFEYFCFQERGK